MIPTKRTIPNAKKTHRNKRLSPLDFLALLFEKASKEEQKEKGEGMMEKGKVKRYGVSVEKRIQAFWFGVLMQCGFVSMNIVLHPPSPFSAILSFVIIILQKMEKENKGKAKAKAMMTEPQQQEVARTNYSASRTRGITMVTSACPI
jgi:hypothetical protein